MKIAIIEDNPSDLTHLSECLNKYLKSLNISFTEQHFDTYDSFNMNVRFDLIFVDILLNNKNGFDLAKKIRESYSEDLTSIIFITTLTQYAIDGYEVGASSYILKPYSYDNFVMKTATVFKKLMQRIDSQVTIYTREKKFINLNINSILYIESNGHYLTYYTKENKYEVRQSMTKCEEIFADKGFFRINSWYLISLRNIDRVTNNEVIINNTSLSISRSRKKDFLKEFTASYGI